MNALRYLQELREDPELLEQILALLPPVPPGAERVILRVPRSDVDAGIARALALAVAGTPAEVEIADE